MLIILKLVEFIKSNSDWENKLKEKPYCITIKRKDNFIMFNYSQIDSDFYNPIVKECRGLILEDNTYKPLCVPFFKFGNYGEGYVDTIDWNSARVQEKVDGSLIKLWYYNYEWKISTNGTINAHDAELASDVLEYKTFYDLFKVAAKNSNLNISKLDKNCTYMFELISPYNRVVVPYTETEIRHLGCRNNITLKEFDCDIGVTKPKTYGFKSLDECIQMASQLPFSEEGYVVVDKNWHRNKIKSPAWVAAHHLKNNGVVTKARIVAMIRINEQDEFLNYYPEYTQSFNSMNDEIEHFVVTMEDEFEYMKNHMDLSNRKEFAEYAKQTMCPPVLFALLDKKCESVTEWLYAQSDEKIVKWIGVDNE